MPLAFPDVGIQKIEMNLKRAVAVSESPFSFDTQTYVHQGARWECNVTLPPLNYDEARSVEAFIVGLKGQSGTFTFGHPLHTSTATGNVNANALIRAEQISLGGSSTAVAAGTYLQLGDYLYITTSSKSAGIGTIDIQPPLRTAVSSGTVVDFTLPKSLFRMAANDISWSTDVVSLYGFTFAFVEAL
tara:strand:- start:680 stop:1240 length:561 start_codon:yes stop_codon:yes gene_type:complete